MNPGSLPPRADALSRLIFELSKLPGVGSKTAARLAYHLLRQDLESCRALSESILRAKEEIKPCSECFSFTDVDPCSICSDSRRERSLLCVVESPSDVHAIEESRMHRGLYHVLHGVLSPIDGIGPERLKITELEARMKRAEEKGEPIREVVIATNPSLEGEATASYLSRRLRERGVRVTKLAHGLPFGGALEFSDRRTLGVAFENRTEMGGGS